MIMDPFAEGLNRHFRKVKKSPIQIEAQALRITVNDDVLLAARILKEQNTMRLVKLVPEWGTFASAEHWFYMRKVLSQSEADRFQAWWVMIFKFQRDARDSETLKFLLAYVLREKQVRAGEKGATRGLGLAPNVQHDPAWVMHLTAMQEFIRTNFERLCPH